MKPHEGGYKAAEWEAALKAAEGLVVRPGREDPRSVSLEPKQITTHPVLFQPRAFLGTRVDRGRVEVDPFHVADLVKAINRKGELNPVTVIKLDKKWVIIDGHHRLAAYRELGWTRLLRCRWFSGSVVEAMDAAQASSTEVKLTASSEDRLEQAWKRVLNGGWTREEIRKLCCIGPGSITRMNKAIAWYNDKSVRTKARYECRAKVKNLKEATWAEINFYYMGGEKKDWTDEARAQEFASRLRERFPRETDTVSRATL
jgi:hypothetical protein